MNTVTPATICPPFANYSHGIIVPAGQQILFCSGQLGISPAREIPDSATAQTELCFENVMAILAEAGLDRQHIVRINAYVSGREVLPEYMAVRDRYVGDPAPASTLMIVSGFAREEFRVEVEVIAAGPAPDA